MKHDPSELPEYELPEWLQRDQDEARQREGEDRAKIGVAVLFIVISSLAAMHAIATYIRGLG